MSRQDVLQKLLSVNSRRLQMLERQRTTDGPDVPPHILVEIEEIQATIARLQSELKEGETAPVKEPPPEIQGLYYNTKDSLNQFRETLGNLSDELKYISPEAQARANSLLEGAKQQFVKSEGAWAELDIQAETAEASLKAIQGDISRAQSNLRLLILRRNHRKRHSLLEEQLAAQQLELTEEQLNRTVGPQVSQVETQIHSLEVQEKLTPHDQQMLTLHKRKLELCQQMLAGERLYAPLNLFIEISDIGVTLKQLDLELARS